MLSLALFLSAQAAPVAVGVVLPSSTRPEFGIAQKLALEQGWPWVAYQVNLPYDPLAAGPEIQAAKEAARPFVQAGVGITLRLVTRPNYGSSRPSPWVRLLEGHAADSAAYPPRPLWDEIASFWNRLGQAMREVCQEPGARTLPSMVRVQLNVEPNIGGVGGPYLMPLSYSQVLKTGRLQGAYDAWNAGDKAEAWSMWREVMAPWTWTDAGAAPPPMGSIPGRYFEMMDYLRGRCQFLGNGLRVSLTCLEAPSGQDWLNQMESWKHPKAAKLASMCADGDLNVYAPDARAWYDPVLKRVRALTPGELADMWAKKVEKAVADCRAHPALSQVRRWHIGEFQIPLHRIPGETYEERVKNAPIYRRALVRKAQYLTAVHTATVFTLLVPKSQATVLNDGYALYELLPDGTVQAVGGEVSPFLAW